MKKTEYIIKVAKRSTDDIRVRKFLDLHGIEYHKGTLTETNYFYLDNVTENEVEFIQENLNMVPQRVYLMFAELMEDGE